MTIATTVANFDLNRTTKRIPATSDGSAVFGDSGERLGRPTTEQSEHSRSPQESTEITEQ